VVNRRSRTELGEKKRRRKLQCESVDRAPKKPLVTRVDKNLARASGIITNRVNAN